MFIVDPGSRILYPTTGPKEERKIFFCPTIFVATNVIKLCLNYFIFEQVKKKICVAKTLRIKVLFTQKFFIKLSKMWIWDPGYGIPGPGSKGHRILESDPQHWLRHLMIQEAINISYKLQAYSKLIGKLEEA
jgi:hypothetical protein